MNLTQPRAPYLNVECQSCAGSTARSEKQIPGNIEIGGGGAALSRSSSWAPRLVYTPSYVRLC